MHAGDYGEGEAGGAEGGVASGAVDGGVGILSRVSLAVACEGEGRPWGKVCSIKDRE